MAKSKFNHVRISGITAVVPEKCINIDDEIEFFNNDVKLLERNKKILGLGTRHIIEDGTAVSDLCEAAAKRLIEKYGIDISTIDTLIVTSTSHDFLAPASSCVIHGRLGLNQTCTCFDLSGLACSGYVHGLMTAHALIESGASKKCLLLAGDLPSTHSDRRNRNSNQLFGDAGTATLLEYSNKVNEAWFETGTRGEGWNKLIMPAGGHYLPIRNDISNIEIFDEVGNVWHLWEDIMKGIEVFKFTTDVGPRGIENILNFSEKSIDSIDYFAFHQANKQIVRTVANYARLPKDKFSWKAFSTYGNCGTAAVVTDVCESLCGDIIHRNVCLATFGVGLSWGFAVLNLVDTMIDNINFYKIPNNNLTREEKIKYWISYYKGEINA